jgi:tetratricopeptide (TPR) repeat protein
MLPSGFGSGLRSSLNKAFAVSGLLASLLAVSLPAHADDLADVTKAVRAGQFADALSKADAYLAKHPRDAQMRFLKGVILTEQNKSAEAITVFTKLTEDYPELPEPYNNLAVLFAANGQYDKARLALDNAIRTNPAYATAYENLGDVHAKLASQAYDKALQLDSGNATAKSKLTLLRTLAGNNNMGKVQTATATAAPVAPTPAPVVPAPAPAKPPVAVAAASVPAPAPAAAKPATPVAAAPVAAAKPEAKPEVKPEVKPAAKPAQDAETEDILTAVRGWAKAWSDQDVKSYLNYYGGDFETPKGESHKDWADERRQRIEGKSRIEVKIDSPQVSVNGNTATVKFRQIYASDRLKADSRKVLVLTKQNGKWQIKQERAGS